MVISKSGSITGSQEQLQNHVLSFLGVLLLRRRSPNSPKVENGLYGNLRYDENSSDFSSQIHAVSTRIWIIIATRENETSWVH